MALLDPTKLRQYETEFAALNFREREVMLMRLIDGLSTKEIANVLNVSPNTVGFHISNAHNKLIQNRNSEPATQHEFIEVRETLEDIRRLSPELIAYLQRQTSSLDSLPSTLFEELIAEFFASWNFAQVGIVGKEKWTGADIVALSRPAGGGEVSRYFIEAKRWKGPVGIEVVEKVLGAVSAERPQYGWHLGMLVTSSRFTSFRRYSGKRISKLGIELRDRNDVEKWLGEYRPNKNGLWLPNAKFDSTAFRNDV